MKMAFVCNGSSIRAQLAAAVAREFFPEAEISAAGSLEETANPEALAVLEEDELSLEGIALKTLFDLDFDLDYAVVVGCDEGGCPLVFANKVIEWDFIPNPQGQGVEVYREA
jgi:protein-tyrosine-phosphatase